MTRYKFSNEETFHVFASRSQDHGRSFHGSVFFTGGTIYSYGTHFPMAIFHGDNLLINADSYSATTGKHQSQLHSATRQYNSVKINMPGLRHVKTLLDMRGDTSKDKQDRAAYASTIISSYDRQIDDIRDSMTRMRADWKKRYALRHIEQLENAANYIWHNICKRRGNPFTAAGKANAAWNKARRITILKNQMISIKTLLKTPANDQITRIKSDLDSGVKSLDNALFKLDRAIYANTPTVNPKEAVKLMGKEWSDNFQSLATAYAEQWEILNVYYLEVKDQWEAAKAVEHAEKLESWINGTLSGSLPRGVPMALRVRNDHLETSKGATVPLADAIKLTKIAAICRVKKTGWKRNGEKHPVGMYQTDRITENGDLIVGCHTIPWKAIQACVTRFLPDLVLATD